MQKEIVCDIKEDFLKCGTEFSDRFIYSNYFIPLLITFDDNKTLILPDYKKALLVDTLKYRVVDPILILEQLPTMGLEDLMKRNEIPMPPITADNPSLRGVESGTGHELEAVAIANDKIRNKINEVRDLMGIFGGKLAENNRGILTVMERKIEEISASAEETARVSASAKIMPLSMIVDTQQYTQRSTPESLGKLKEQQIEFFLNLLKSDIGYVFLDRTRIRPNGFAIGEHLYALSLAPGEEIVLEQKTFSKRQLTLEEQNEQEKQFDLELSSTLSTEIQEGFERQKNLTDSWGLSLSHTGQYTSPKGFWGEFNASHTIGYTRNASEANQETRRRSVKDSQTASSKAASKYRTLHKTTFKISTEEGFESTSKRVIRNPNRFTPIVLHYFKVLQKLQMTQERYGVRLCWTPCIKDPAYDYFDQIRKGKEEILTKAKESLSPKPIEPQPTPPSGGQTTTQTEKKMFYSEVMVLDKWTFGGGMSYDYDVDIPCDTGHLWDGDIAVVNASINLITKRTDRWATVRGIPLLMQNTDGKNVLRAKVHVGAGDWLGGPGISMQVGAQFIKTQTATDKTNEDSIYKEKLTTYQTKLKEWEDNAAQVIEKAQQKADTWENEMLRSANPLIEMINQIIKKLFPPAVRDECWEIDLWQKLFDWERASYLVFPSWWSDLPMRDATKEPTHFVNASWAKLYLPVRVGMERLALRWIFGKTVATNLSKEIEDQFDKIEQDLKNYREATFGSPSEIIELADECKDFTEKFDCISKWQELMPTDGAHLEFIQGYTGAADQFSKTEVGDANKLRNAMIESREQDAALKKKALNQMTSAANLDINISTDGGASG